MVSDKGAYTHVEGRGGNNRNAYIYLWPESGLIAGGAIAGVLKPEFYGTRTTNTQTREMNCVTSSRGELRAM